MLFRSGLVVLGTGLFKPNISAIVGQLYGKDNEGARDGGYTLFYMGVNAGAFFGISLCGYIGEKVSWNLGFGLAGLFMILGAIQFWLSQGLFGAIGDKIDAAAKSARTNPQALEFVLGELRKLLPGRGEHKRMRDLFKEIFDWDHNDPKSMTYLYEVIRSTERMGDMPEFAQQAEKVRKDFSAKLADGRKAVDQLERKQGVTRPEIDAAKEAVKKLSAELEAELAKVEVKRQASIAEQKKRALKILSDAVAESINDRKQEGTEKLIVFLAEKLARKIKRVKPGAKPEPGAYTSAEAEKELTKRSNATAAAIKKILSRSKDIQVIPSADGKKNVQSLSCLSNGFCAHRDDKVHIHNEVILSSANEKSLVKALDDIKKLSGKEAALITSGINPVYDYAAHEKAHMEAIKEGRRLVEAAAESIAKDSEKWHVVTMQFVGQEDQCPMPMMMMMGGMQHPPMDAQMQNMMPNAQAHGQHGQQNQGNKPATVTLKVRATIALQSATPKN